MDHIVDAEYLQKTLKIPGEIVGIGLKKEKGRTVITFMTDRRRD
jgi:hypothetical protein